MDASVNEGQSSFTIGMVLRNDKGDFVAIRKKRIAGRSSVLEAEAMGVQEALC